MYFHGIAALRDIHTTMAAGEIRGLIGPNGAGKSTLLNIISRFYTPSRGTVWLDGMPLSRLPVHAVTRHGVSRTFQNLELFEAMTILDNVLVGDHTQQRSGVWGAALRPPWVRREAREARDRAMAMLQMVGLEALWYRPARDLSFGQRRLLELARALVARPKLLLLDEPASGLSPPVLQRLIEVILQHRESYNMAILLVAHVIKIVHDVCQSVTVLDSGEVIAEGPPEVIRHDPRVIKAYLGQPISQSFATTATRPATATHQTPSAHNVQHGSRPTAIHPVMLEVAGVDSYYGPLQVLAQVSLRAHHGEVVALLGGNGSGKSTLLRTISGFVRPRCGTITVAGRPVQGQRPDLIVRHGVIHIPQGREIFPMLTVLENLYMGAYRRREPAAIARDLERVYTYFPILAERAAQYAGYLSGGEQQMLAIGRGLMAQPTLLLLDEPSASLAPLVADNIFRTLAAMKTDGFPLLIVEQNVRAALAIADYVYVLRHGTIVTQGMPEALQQGELLYRAYLGR
jgi:ABC-type branched-subunit amino acid transport system ATPase component